MNIRNWFKKNISLPLTERLTSVGWQQLNLFSGYYSSISKEKLIVEGYGQNPYVNQVVNKIAGVISRLQYEIKNGEKLVTTGEVYDLFTQPNHYQSFNEFMENIMLEILVSGECFILQLTGGFTYPVELTVLKTRGIFINQNNGEILSYRYTDIGLPKVYQPEQVIHIKLTNIVDIGENSLRGRSPLEALRQVYESSNNIFTAENYIFKNGGTVGVLTNDSDVPMLPDEISAVNRDWKNENSGATKFGSVHLTNAKLRYLAIGVSPKDLVLIESNTAKLRTICSAYGVDSSLFNDPANKTFSNRTEAQKSFYEDVVIPYAQMVLNRLNKDIIAKGFGSTEKITINTEAIKILTQ